MTYFIIRIFTSHRNLNNYIKYLQSFKTNKILLAKNDLVYFMPINIMDISYYITHGILQKTSVGIKNDYVKVVKVMLTQPPSAS